MISTLILIDFGNYGETIKTNFITVQAVDPEISSIERKIGVTFYYLISAVILKVLWKELHQKVLPTIYWNSEWHSMSFQRN